MKTNLPTGWALATVSDLSQTLRGVSYKKGDEQRSLTSTNCLVLRGGNIQNGKVVSADDNVYVDKKLVLEKQLLQQGDVVIVSSTGSVRLIGKAAAVLENTDNISFGAFLSMLRPKPEINEKFFGYFFQSAFYRSAIRELAAGTNINNIRNQYLEDLAFPLPPLDEQCRIVDQLDAAMQRFEASQERLDKLPDLLKRFRQAVLAAAVSGKLTEAWRAEQPQGETGADLLDRIHAERRAQWEEKQQAKLSGKQLSLNDSWKSKYEEPATPDTSELLELPAGWTWATVEQLAKVGTGATPLKSNSDYYEGGLIPWVTSGALNNLFVTEAEEHITSLAVAETNAKIFPIGTLLVALYGEGKTRGKTSELAIEAATNQACAAIVFDLAATNIKDFVKLFFRKNYEDLRKLAAGGVQPNLNLGLIKTTRIPFPPLDEQQEIVRQVNHYFGLADQLEVRFEQATALVEQLPQALLAKAFSGQLVPQDPDDEPADVLLKRLQAEPAAPVKGKRGRKAKVAGEAPLFE